MCLFPSGGNVSSHQVQASTLLSGSFSLAINGLSTTILPFNATGSAMSAALQALGTGPVNVSREGPDVVNGYTWHVTFTATELNYDVPEMTCVPLPPLDFIASLCFALPPALSNAYPFAVA